MHHLSRVESGNRNHGFIYLDNHATTPIDPRVAKSVFDCSLDYLGNPHSEHAAGDEANTIVQRAREEVAQLVGARSTCVVFTSGATESLNLAIHGFVRRHNQKHRKPPRIALTSVEHAAVLEVCQALARAGDAEVVEIPVNRVAHVDLDAFAEICSTKIDLACVMAANNEVGTIYPLQPIATIARQYGAHFLTDATQAVGKVPLAFDEWGIDLMALSAHKLYGPKGVGALIVRSKEMLAPVYAGGAQEWGLRPGTLNVPGIAGLGEACRLRRAEMVQDEESIARRRDRLEYLLMDAVPMITVNGDRRRRLAGNLHITIPGAPGTAIVARLRDTVAISTGSACSSGADGPSHVLQAMGLSQVETSGALRISVGKFTTDDEIESASRLIAQSISQTLQALEDVRA